jgi:hypothetical protein
MGDNSDEVVRVGRLRGLGKNILGNWQFYFRLNIDRLRIGCDKTSERKSFAGTED